MKYILLDGNSFCYRAFYAVRDLRNSKGEPTNAVYGFVTMLEKLLKDVDPQGVALTFDLKGPTFRHERYKEYKIQRSPMPEDLVFQMPIIKEVVRAYNIPIFEKEGFEADDVIATVACRLEKEGHEVFIVTGDKDALQLVTKKIKVLNPQKENQILDEKSVHERFGITPDQVVEIMALMGDVSDNIPGVSGVGEKTAVKLIGEYGTLENVYKNIDKIKGDKLKENLVKYRDDAFMSRELATIDKNAPVDIDVKTIQRQEPNQEKLTEIFKRLEFRTLLKNSQEIQKTDNAGDESLDYHLVTTEEDFQKLVKHLKKHKAWAFDFETTGTDPLKAEPVGISFSFKAKQAFYIAFDISGHSKLSAKHCLGMLKDLFEDSSYKKIGQNIKYEAMVLRKQGIDLQGISFDTMVASYCINTAKPNHNMDDIALEYLGLHITPITDIIGSGKTQITMDKADIQKVYRYGCQDSDIVFRLKEVMEPKLKERDLVGLFEKIEMPLVKILAEMEYEGIAIDKKMLFELSKEMEISLAKLTKLIHEAAGCEFNINSPKQLAEILFEKLKLPVVKRTKTGASTDVEVLTELSETHSLPKEILKFRELSKLKSTYVDALPELADSSNNRIHSSFNQTVTATGRLSSSDPNLQNIPVRTEEGRKIRKAFIAGSKNHVLVSADYSQIELRVLAHMSGDENLIKAFHDGLDIHRFTASLIFDVPLKEVTDSMRNSAKTVNFGVLYGMGAFSLAKTLDISHEAARDFIKAYFDRYPSVKKYLDETIEKAKRDGFVSTEFKRRRYIPEIHARDMRLKNFAERTAINAPIQGTASDIIKIAMRCIFEKLASGKFKSKMILQVHDELVFETPKDELESLVLMIREEMSGCVKFEVPLDVSIKVGSNWMDMEAVR